MSDLNLEPIETWARAELERKNTAREQVLRWSRELVRACANSIRAVHRREFEQAEELVGEASALNARICSTLEDMADIYWTGYVQDAQKELVEACCTLALVTGSGLPDPATLGIAPAPFVNGLAEAVGEMRRIDLVGRNAGLDPLLDRAHLVEGVGARAALTVVHAGHHVELQRLAARRNGRLRALAGIDGRHLRIARDDRLP